jgi:hypothetical protein
MASLQRRYAEVLHENFSSYYANFPPNRPVALGDFGTLADGTFTRVGSLTESFGVTSARTAISAEGAAFQFSSKKGVILELEANAGASAGQPTGKAKASIRFNAANAVFFAAADCKVETYTDELPVRAAILDLFAAETWDPKWTLVTGRITAGALNLVVSSEAGAFIDLAVDGAATIDFADAQVAAGLKVTGSACLAHQFVAQTGTIPFLQLVRVRRRLLGSVIVHTENRAAEAPEDVLRERARLVALDAPLTDKFEVARIEGDTSFGW